MDVIIDEVEDVLRQIQPQHRFWQGALVIMSAFPRVETFWRNPELAGVWQFSFSTRRHCTDALFERWLFEERIGMHRVSPVYVWIGPR